MVTKPVTIKAMLRVCGELSAQDAEPEENRVDRWRERLAPWSAQVETFRHDGFYERFPAKGQVERVARVAKDLLKLANIPTRGRQA